MRGYERHPWMHAGTSADEIGALIGVGGGERVAAPFLGVKALMLAILEDAMRAYLGPLGCSHDEAAAWIADGRSRWLFSFAVVCETLGLEPAAVRAAVHRLRGRAALVRPPTAGRSRPNSRRQAGLRIAAPSARTGLEDTHGPRPTVVVP